MLFFFFFFFLFTIFKFFGSMKLPRFGSYINNIYWYFIYQKIKIKKQKKSLIFETLCISYHKTYTFNVCKLMHVIFFLNLQKSPMKSVGRETQEPHQSAKPQCSFKLFLISAIVSQQVGPCCQKNLKIIKVNQTYLPDVKN